MAEWAVRRDGRWPHERRFELQPLEHEGTTTIRLAARFNRDGELMSATIAETTDVRKTGRTTGTTDGRIQVIELDGIVLDVPGLGSVEYDGLVEMEGDGRPFAEPGDSGALVTDRQCAQR